MTIERYAQDWRHDGACADSPEPELWWPFKGDSADALEAKKVCAGCPVAVECGTAAVDEEDRGGIRAGRFTGDKAEWLELREWVAGHDPGVAESVSVRLDNVCKACGAVFEAKRAMTLCWPCNRGLVPDGPTLEHVDRLHAAGMTYLALAEKAGLTYNTVYDVCRRRGFIHPDRAAAILAVPMPSTTPCRAGHCLSGPTIAHLEAMHAAGQSWMRVAARCGIPIQHLHRLRHQDTVTIALADRVLATPIRPDADPVELEAMSA